MSEAERYDTLREKGVSPQDAARHILAQRNADTGQAADATTQAPPFNPWGMAGGLSEAALDIPRSIASAAMHPIQTAGQITGLGNIPKAVSTFQDPEAGLAEKIGAAIQATPLNMGYAPERALLESTGAKSDEPGSTEEQAHRAGNVASLALLGVNPKTPLRVMGKGMGWLGRNSLMAAVGDRLASLGSGAKTGAAVPIEEAPMTQLDPINRPGPPAPPDAVLAARDYAAGKIRGEDLSDALDVAAGRPLPPDAPATTPPKVQNPLDALRSVPDASLTPTPPLEQSAAAPGVTEGRAASAMQSALGKEPAVAKSYLELQQLLRKGIPRDQIKVDYWTRGGSAEQSIPPTHALSPPTPNPAMTEASRPLAEALGQVPKAGSASAVAGAMQSPAYQGASRLAHHAVVQGWGPFQGMSEPEATAALQKMILERVQGGREIPPITSIKKFLDRLAGS